MNVVFLSPHFPPGMYLYVQRLREAGATVLGMADAPYEALRPELREALTEYYRVGDMHDHEALVRAIGYFTHRYGRIDRIESLNEYWLETDARLRSDFNVFGLRAETIDRVKRKSVMKRVFERAGVPVARGRVVRRGSAPVARHFVEEVGYPIIAKPDVGVGAARTYRIENDTDLDAFLGDRTNIDYILEEYLEGTLLSYDGLVDRRGDIVFASSLVYGLTVLDSVRGADMYYWIDREIAPDLDELGHHIVDAFGVRERPFHFEFFRVADGTLVALEVNMRQPGGLTVDMWNWANDIDFYRAWADVVVNGTTTVPTKRPWYTMWVGRKVGRTYRLTHDEVVAAMGPLLIHHERIDDVFATAIGNYGYILRGPDLEPLQDAAHRILAVA
jgi:ATP-grasp domain-containing protein